MLSVSPSKEFSMELTPAEMAEALLYEIWRTARLLEKDHADYLTKEQAEAIKIMLDALA